MMTTKNVIMIQMIFEVECFAKGLLPGEWLKFLLEPNWCDQEEAKLMHNLCELHV